MATPPVSGVHTPVRIIRMQELIGTIGLSKSTIYNRMDPRSKWYDKNFPLAIKLGKSAIGWRSSDIEMWILTLSQSVEG